MDVTAAYETNMHFKRCVSDHDEYKILDVFNSQDEFNWSYIYVVYPSHLIELNPSELNATIIRRMK